MSTVASNTGNDVVGASLTPSQAPVIEVFIPRDIDALRGALALLGDASVVSVDIETHGLSSFRDEILSIAIEQYIIVT